MKEWRMPRLPKEREVERKILLKGGIKNNRNNQGENQLSFPNPH